MRLTDICKGEMTMGDHVIGATPGGFKIHASRGSDHASYAGMKPADHIVAANMHAKAARDLNIKSGQMGGSMTLKRQAANHLHIATTHRQAGTGAPQKLAASLRGKVATMLSSSMYADAMNKADGAGSRGGNVIGHTKSGKAIYGNESKHYDGLKSHHEGHAIELQRRYKSFSATDHQNAHNAHKDEAVEARLEDNTKKASRHEAMASLHKQAAEHLSRTYYGRR